MRVYLDGVKKHEVRAASVAVSLPAASGTHRLTVRAWDRWGSFQSSVQFRVGGGNQGGNQAATVTPAALTFGDQVIGTSSAAQQVVITNSGTTSLSVTGATATGPFTVAGLSAAQSLSPGQQITLGVTFAPAALGAANGSLSVSFQSLANKSVSLSGNGISEPDPDPKPEPPPTGTPCTGTSLSQTVRSVTAEFTNIGLGVAISQLTDSGNNAISYIGVPVYSAPADVITWNHFSTTQKIATARLDGSEAQTIGEGQSVTASVDGRLLYWVGRGNAGGSDIFGTFISTAGICQTVQLTNLNLVPIPPTPVIHVTTSGKLSDGRNVIAFSPGDVIRRVAEDGQLLDGAGINPPDKYSGSTYHRILLNPKFPDWVAYKRNSVGSVSGTLEMFLVNFRDPNTVYTIGNLNQKVGHPVWSPDGKQFGFADTDAGAWNVSDIFDGNGNLLLNAEGRFTTRTIGADKVSHSAAEFNANYCEWAPDGSVFLCTSGFAKGLKIFLLATDGSWTKFLSNSDAVALNDKGIPIAVFAKDGKNVIFRSDRTGTPQVYRIDGFSLSP